jgi:hypothetical protein
MLWFRLRQFLINRLSYEQFMRLTRRLQEPLREFFGEPPPGPVMLFDAKPKWPSIKLNERIQAAFYGELFDAETLRAIDEFNHQLEELLHVPRDDPVVVATRRRRQQERIQAAVGRCYPRGVIPDSDGPADVRRKTATYFKPYEPPGWDTYKSFLKRYRVEDA